MEYLIGNRAFVMLGCRLRWLAEHLSGNRTFATLGCRVQLLAAISDQFTLQFYHTDVPHARIRHHKHKLTGEMKYLTGRTALMMLGR